MNLDEALAAHKAWNMVLQDFIHGEGDLDPEVIGADHHCEIGKWIHAEEGRLKTLPEYAATRDVHAQLHECAGEIVTKVRAGMTETAMDMLHSDYRGLQGELIDSLTVLMSKLGTNRAG